MNRIFLFLMLALTPVLLSAKSADENYFFSLLPYLKNLPVKADFQKIFNDLDAAWQFWKTNTITSTISKIESDISSANAIIAKNERLRRDEFESRSAFELRQKKAIEENNRLKKHILDLQQKKKEIFASLPQSYREMLQDNRNTYKKEYPGFFVITPQNSHLSTFDIDSQSFTCTITTKEFLSAKEKKKEEKTHHEISVTTEKNTFTIFFDKINEAKEFKEKYNSAGIEIPCNIVFAASKYLERLLDKKATYEIDKGAIVENAGKLLLMMVGTAISGKAPGEDCLDKFSSIDRMKTPAEYNDYAMYEIKVNISFFDYHEGSNQRFQMYFKEAQAGDAEAQFKLSSCYKKGIGTKKNLTSMFYWLCQAAHNQHREAQNDLGYCYDTGKGVEKNAIEAVRWYTTAANAGYAPAQYNLAECYYSGNGVPKNRNMAIYWYRQAALQNDTSAKKALHELGEEP